MMARVIDLGGTPTPADIEAIAHGAKAIVSDAARLRIKRASALLDDLIAQRRRVYGVTTGFGPLAQHYIAPDQTALLQRQLIYHLASGVGQPLPPVQVRAIMAARIASLAQGGSGVSGTVIDLMLGCLDHGIIPCIPEMGTVGASGDLTPLAHMALCLMGEGEVLLDGQKRPAGEALAKAGLVPLDPGRKDGLALVNGTSAMTGIAALNDGGAARAFDQALLIAALIADVSKARMEAYDDALSRARPHPGQAKTAARLRHILHDSQRVMAPEWPNPVLKAGIEAAGDGVLAAQTCPQDAYSLRCLPQELGAAFDLLQFHHDVVTRELAAVSDNPLIDVAAGHAVHGGNFYGQHVAYVSDCLMLPLIKLAVHGERLINRLTDPVRNGGLPAFLSAGTVGMSSGLMGAQVTATALVAEMRGLATPMSIQSIATNADNQDVVTMGTIAARKAARLLDILWRLLAIEAITASHAMALYRARGEDGFASATRAFGERILDICPPLSQDRPLGAEIERVAALLSLPHLPDDGFR